ncbi:Lysophospholipid acyltransferase 5 [Geodia barretti]|uniref:Lysophospholipid acyltransferase 5 n=1 Tax=Geodia barretti TaxID=519541 RepID=A0AA35W869_GEOBA|nr:Lysophospholipid acyltransferase 5 [Geodia barretti]
MLGKGPSYLLSDVLHLPEPSARFLLALYGAYLFSFIYRYYVSRHGAAVQNLYWTMSGVLMVVYIYGWGVWHMLLDTVAVYCTLRLIGGTLLSVVITWLITMGHLVGGYLHIMYSNEIHPIAWTIPHCVMVLKMIGLAYSLYDGRKKQETLVSEDIRKNAVHSVPSFLEVMGFSFFPGSVLAGPQMWFVRYRDFVEGRLFDYQKTPSSTFAGVKRLLLGTTLSVLYASLNNYYPIEFLATKGFADEMYIRKLWLVFISGKVVLWRYIAVWLIAEGSCIVTGISYNGETKEGEADWSGLTNIKLFDFETCITLQGVVDSFNINTNSWMALYVYKRLKWLGSKELSLALTLVFISLWHGIWPGYYFNFSLEFIDLTAERTFHHRAKKLLGGELSDTPAVVRVPLSLIAYCLKNLILMYPTTLFMLLSWTQCYAVRHVCMI